jgi:RHS repeat-associated protein
MPGRKYSQASTKYRYGFNGKENDNDVKGEGNQQDYGNRIYDPRLGRFLSVDPLQKKFPALSSYQFCGDNPIATIDLDGLEPAAINPGTQTLVLILQGYGVDPPDGATQASNAAITNPGSGPDEALGSIVSTGPKLQVVVYASSQTDNTKNDVLSTIKNFRSVNPDGKVIVIGHSGGGDNLIELAKNNKDVTFDLLITLDTQDPKIYGIDDNNVGKNVKNAINYYQTSESIGGETLDFKSKETKGANILSPGSNHRSIDNDQLDNVISDMNNFIMGRDAVKLAKERVQPTYNPANTNSTDVFAPGDKSGATKGTANPKSTRDDNKKSSSSQSNKKPGG